MRYASFGSVSHATLRTEDLLQAFADALDYQLKRQPRSYKRAPYRRLVREAQALLTELEHGATANGLAWQDAAADCVNDLQDALGEFAPPYGYFGAHPGDGSDFGYWIGELDDIDALRVADTSEVPRDYSGEVLHINDHGNATLYAAKHGRLREIWGIV